LIRKTASADDIGAMSFLAEIKINIEKWWMFYETSFDELILQRMFESYPILFMPLSLAI
jgi:hypothetical protein